MSAAPHPTTVVLPEPINVSPLIRFGRWAALGAGVIYGAVRLHQIKEYHADIRQWQHEKAVVAAEEAAKKKKWLAKDEMRYLMQVVNLPFEEGVKQFGVTDLYKDE
uniref:ATP synthase F(0) complex subunit e, mitochondrial n=1 Tax=Panagrellus redivivus TaxID=6233 RepID=A0A7E4UNK8_PANRE